MGIVDAVFGGVKSLLEAGIEAIASGFGNLMTAVLSKVIATPHPLPDDALFTFSPPESGVWAALWGSYQYMLLITTALMILAVAFIMLSGTYSNDAKARKSLREVLFWYPVAMSWWWIGGIFLKFVHATTTTIVGGASFGGEAATSAIVGAGAGIVIAYIFSSTAWSILMFMAVVYFARWVLIHVFHVLMPPLLMLRVFPFKPVQGFADSIVSKYPPIVLTTIPVAILLRIGFDLLTYPDVVGGIPFVKPLVAITVLALAGILPKFTMTASRAMRRSANKARRSAGGNASGMASGMKAVGANVMKTGITGNKGGSGQQTLNTGVNASQSATGSGSSSGASAGSSSGGPGPDPHMADVHDMDFKRKGRRRRKESAFNKTTTALNTGRQMIRGAMEGKEEGDTTYQSAKNAAFSGVKEPFNEQDGVLRGGKTELAAAGAKRASYAAETAREKLMSNRSEAAQMDEDDIDRDASFDDMETDAGPPGDAGESETPDGDFGDGSWDDWDYDRKDDLRSNKWHEDIEETADSFVEAAEEGDIDVADIEEDNARELVDSIAPDDADFGEKGSKRRKDAEDEVLQQVSQETGESVAGFDPTDEDTDDAPEPPPMPGTGGPAGEEPQEQTAASGASSPDPETPSQDDLLTETPDEIRGEASDSGQPGDTPAMVGTGDDPVGEEEQTVSDSRAEEVDDQYIGLSEQSASSAGSGQSQSQTPTESQTTSEGSSQPAESGGQSEQSDLEPHQEAVQEHLETTKQSAEDVSPVEVAGKLATEDDRINEPNEVTDYVKQLQDN